MPTIVQFRRGTTVQNNNFTGAAGELSIDTDLEVVRVHDGATVGGFQLIGANATQTLTNKTVSVTGGILNGNSNGVSNIGNSTTYFNTVFAKATSAQYADVAEKYIADAEYLPGTVMEIGGSNEVTMSQTFATPKICGVISTNPALIMNAGQSHEFSVMVALAGRVPCNVVGKIHKGDLVCASDLPGVATALPADRYSPGAVIGKSLEDYDSDQVGTIEVLVGRL